MKTAKHIEAYLDGFDNFSRAVIKRYGAEARERISPDAMISLYRGFLTALPDMAKAGREKDEQRISR